MPINSVMRSSFWVSDMAATKLRSRTQQPKLALSVQYIVKPADVPNRSLLQKWMRAALRENAKITLRIVDEAEGRTLNHDYRHKDYATNVLTFKYSGAPQLSGDIVLCAPVVSREAQEQDISIEAHYAHLVVHGVLHLQGYDHMSEDDAAIMEKLETQIVTTLGYANPYAELH